MLSLNAKLIKHSVDVIVLDFDSKTQDTQRAVSKAPPC